MNLNLPKIYEENLFEWVPGIDNIPEPIDLIPKGYTLEHCEKLRKLATIEGTKYALNELINDGEITDDEIESAKQFIAELITEYNNM